MARVVRPSWTGTDGFYTPRIGKGQVLFTGPDGIRDHRVTVMGPNKYIGIGAMSPEGTGDVHYLFRPARRCPHPLSKNKRVGEIGWGLQLLQERKLRNEQQYQIKLLEFRQACEDRYKNLYQNPPYPKSKIRDLQEEAEQKCSKYPHYFDNVVEETFSTIPKKRSQTPAPPRAPKLVDPDFNRPRSVTPGSMSSRKSESRSSQQSCNHTHTYGKSASTPRSSISSEQRERVIVKAW